MTAFRLLISLFLLYSVDTKAQLDSNKIFEKSKGTWMRPLSSGTQILNSSGGFIHDKATFTGMKDSSVFAVFDSRVIAIQKKDNNYILITKFGEYTLTYFVLSAPVVKNFEFIKAGQYIGKLAEDDEGMFEIQIYLDKGPLRIDPNTWFK